MADQINSNEMMAARNDVQMTLIVSDKKLMFYLASRLLELSHLTMGLEGYGNHLQIVELS